MTYFGFLLIFLLIPIFGLLYLLYRRRKQEKNASDSIPGRAVWVAIGIQIALAMLYTTPWDNYLVATGVWHYNRALVTGILLGYVPLEEYTFFCTRSADCWFGMVVAIKANDRFGNF